MDKTRPTLKELEAICALATKHGIRKISTKDLVLEFGELKSDQPNIVIPKPDLTQMPTDEEMLFWSSEGSAPKEGN